MELELPHPDPEVHLQQMILGGRFRCCEAKQQKTLSSENVKTNDCWIIDEPFESLSSFYLQGQTHDLREEVFGALSRKHFVILILS